MADHGRVITAKLPQPLVIQLDEVVERIDRSKSWVVREALSEWLGQDQRRQELRNGGNRPVQLCEFAIGSSVQGGIKSQTDRPHLNYV